MPFWKTICRPADKGSSLLPTLPEDSAGAQSMHELALAQHPQLGELLMATQWHWPLQQQEKPIAGLMWL
jgi:hypothetical protein